MILPCEIPQLDIPDVGRNHAIEFFLVTVRKIISVQEIYSGSFLASWLVYFYKLGAIFDNQ